MGILIFVNRTREYGEPKYGHYPFGLLFNPSSKAIPSPLHSSCQWKSTSGVDMAGKALFLGAALGLAGVQAIPKPINYQQSSCVIVNVGTTVPYMTQRTTTTLPAGQPGYTTTATSSGSIYEIAAVTQQYQTISATTTLTPGQSGFTSFVTSSGIVYRTEGITQSYPPSSTSTITTTVTANAGLPASTAYATSGNVVYQ